ncbi:MAG: hypothetical protein JW889_02290 [Verrucomicrobia bacterium]|nr:hypothetical protein [Verrucomicrobiota bacterium]
MLADREYVIAAYNSALAARVNGAAPTDRVTVRFRDGSSDFGRTISVGEAFAAAARHCPELLREPPV